MGADLVICSKSTWEPPIRREHALAHLASRDGMRVVFVERPADVRAARRGAAAWGRGLIRPARRCVAPGIEVVSPSSLVPGHRGAVPLTVETALMARVLGREATPGAMILSTVPWQWPAVAKSAARRRVHDCADDWAGLIPSATTLVRALDRRIAGEADAVVAANRALARSFAPAAAHVVPNGVDRTLIDAPATASIRPRSMVYVGTLSERLDMALMAAVLERLPDWSLDLWGQCQFAGRGDAPSPAFEAFLARSSGRARWLGVLPRDRLSGVLDAAEVLIVPIAAGLAAGSSMKLFDYAARGRPIVTTCFQPGVAEDGPPRLRVADDARDFAEAVQEAAHEPPEAADARRAWAGGQTWDARWPAWRRALMGAVPSTS